VNEEKQPKRSKLSELEIIRQNINKKLSGTPLTLEFLEEKYNNDTQFCIVYDLKGNSIWFNASYMNYTGRKETDFLKANFLETLMKLNEEHPVTEIFLRILQEQPEEFKCEFLFLIFFS
jgi:PAS domain-containing protein